MAWGRKQEPLKLNDIFKSGTHTGKTVSQVANEESGYIIYALDFLNMEFDDEVFRQMAKNNMKPREKTK